jgi:predicted AAA+ superfamily ATPase
MINHEIIGKGFDHLLQAMVPYVSRELALEYGENWWSEGVLSKLYDRQKENLPLSGTTDELKKSMDILLCLNLIDIRWNDVFKRKLATSNRNWVKELIETRNRWAHTGSEDTSDGDTERALDTMARLCEQIDNTGRTEEIRKLYRTVRYGTEGGSADTSGKNIDVPLPIFNSLSGLPSWRDVIEPHPDVAQGKYRNAEFAADLAQVSRGTATPEYQDPVEFFSRTYITVGMKRLLIEAIKRVNGTGGEPVVQLKTAFGGGKTHTMLALYHLLRDNPSKGKIPAIQSLLQESNLELPHVNVAVIVGTAYDPSTKRRPVTMPGITINTIWGEIAAQLAESAGNPDLYNIIKTSDAKHTSPGSKTFVDLFNKCGPCVILMDELVAYAKKLYGVSDLPAGSFDNFITFIQEITEAARASKNCLIVASIPESDLEIGGDAGQIALDSIEHTFGRMESIWKPVAANEGFEVVRRRLFLNCKNTANRDLVCETFSKLYNDNPSEFPIESRELEYTSRLKSCYPIHPEVFDRLYEDWATLEHFQKTRGVLRLMASVIHDLWMNKDSSPLIMPGSISLDNSDIKNELTRYLDDNWNALVDREIDGKNSIPFQKDKNDPRYGRYMASRRVARTIFLGSAPSVKEQSIRGIDVQRIRIGVVQPGENIGVFNDALNSLSNSLAYLYSDPTDGRFWYDTRPTLRKTVNDRASQIPESEIEKEIEIRLNKMTKDGRFAGIHVCPNSSLDVPDIQNVRLVVLRPVNTYKETPEGNNAVVVSEKILNTRGEGPRIYRNMLTFVAPDHAVIDSLKSAVKMYLAWKSVRNDAERLNLDIAQTRESDANVKAFNDTVNLRVRETYCWLLVPYIDRNEDISRIQWDKIRISGGTDPITKKAADKLINDEYMIVNWSPALLRRELDSLLWMDSDDIEIKKLWDQLCTYCYLPRLSSYSVLETTIRQGLQSDDYFALSTGLIDGKYAELKHNFMISQIDSHNHLVKIGIALEQIKKEKEKAESEKSGNPEGHKGEAIIDQTGPVTPSIIEKPVEMKHIHFRMTKELDYVRVNKDMNQIVSEIVQPLASINGAKVRISIIVETTVPDGISSDKERTVNENCRTLKIDDKEFY